MHLWPKLSRAAFSLVELLVVIGIMAMLMGLLLPAIQKVREAARKDGCQAALRAIGYALHEYHADYFKFPKGQFNYIQPHYIPNTITVPNIPNDKDRRCWFHEVIPYIYHDDRNLFGKMEPHMQAGGTSWTIPNRFLPHKMFMCPSDPFAGKNMTRTDIEGNYRGVYPPQLSQGFHGNYVLCAGSGYFNPVDDRYGLRLDGMFFPQSQVRVTDVRDGVSNTVMGGEITLSLDTNYSDPVFRCTCMCSDRERAEHYPPGIREHEDIRGRYYNSMVGNTLFSTLRPPFSPDLCQHHTNDCMPRVSGIPCGDIARCPPQCCKLLNASTCCPSCCVKSNPWPDHHCMTEYEYDNMLRAQFVRSDHPGAVHMLFGDGSVRRITDEVELALYQALGSRAGGEIGTEDF